MKKGIALFAAACILANTHFALAEEKHSLLGTGYEFTDAAYSESLGVYVAVARDYTASTNGQPLPINVFKSEDGVNWTRTLASSSAYFNANKDSRNTIVWYESANVFVLSSGDNIYTSEDGTKWVAKKKDNNNQGIVRGNAMIAANGDRLLVSGGRAVKFVTPDNINDLQVEHHIFDPSNANTTTIAAGVSTPDDDGNVTYMSITSGKCWFYYDEYEEGTNGNVTGVSTCNNTFSGANFVRDCVFENNTRSWLVTNNSKYLYTINADSRTLANFPVNGIESISAVGTDGEVVIVGGTNGELCYTSTYDTLTKETTWTDIDYGTGERDDEIRTITPTTDGRFIMLTKTNIYIIAPSEDGYITYNTSWQGIAKTSGSDTLIVPESNSITEEYVFDVTDYMNNPIPNSITSVSMTNTIDGVDFDNGTLTLDPSCRGGVANIKVVSVNGASKEFKVTIIAEDYIVFEGETGLIIPTTGTETETISAYIVGTDGNRMDRTVLFDGTYIPQGVTFDKDSATLSISSSASPDELIIHAYSKANPELVTNDRIYELDKAYVSAIEVVEGQKEITVPTSGTADYTYTAVVKNQAGKEMKGATVTWSVDGFEGITIDDKGKLTVTTEAYSGVALIRATSTETPSIYGEYEVHFSVSNHKNLLSNGDVETGKTDGFEGEELSVVSQKQHAGKYAIMSKGGSVSIPLDFEIKADSVYYVASYISAESGKATMEATKSSMSVSDTAIPGYVKLIGNIRTSRKLNGDMLTINVAGATSFYVDDVRVFEITEEYNKVARLVANAESSKKQTDANKAKDAVAELISCPAKTELENRIAKIKVGSQSSSDSGKPSGGGGGGGGGGGTSATVPSTTVQVVTTPADNEDNSQKVVYNKLKFKDMSNHWAVNEVEELATKNIIAGREDGTFDPDANITRAEFCVLIDKALGLSEETYANDFFDVISDDWCSGWIQTARSANIVSGSNGMFYPEANITREEMAKMVVGAYASKSKKAITTGGAIYFRDEARISAWAWDYIQNSVELGLMTGKDEYLFAPKDNATRAEAAVVLKRLIDLLA